MSDEADIWDDPSAWVCGSVCPCTPKTCPSCGGPTCKNWFDRSLCPCEPGIGAMHTRCDNCGTALDGCSFEEDR